MEAKEEFKNLANKGHFDSDNDGVNFDEIWEYFNTKKKETAIGFADFTRGLGYCIMFDTKYWHYEDKTITTSELFTIYINQL